MRDGSAYELSLYEKNSRLGNIQNNTPYGVELSIVLNGNMEHYAEPEATGVIPQTNKNSVRSVWTVVQFLGISRP